MKLNFLANPVQRNATGKNLPTRQLEAFLKYGPPAERAKAVERMVKFAPNFVQHAVTAHLAATLVQHTDNLQRCEILYSLRNKLLDLCRTRHGNTFVQALVAALPVKQRSEIAQALRPEIAELARHQFGNRVVQKLLDFPEAFDEIRAELVEAAPTLAKHELGQFVISKCMQMENGESEETTNEFVAKLTESTDALESFLDDVLEEQEESAVASHLVKAILTSSTMGNTNTNADGEEEEETFRDIIVSILTDGMEDFVEKDTHHFVVSQFLECATPEEIDEFFDEAMKPRLDKMVSAKAMSKVASHPVILKDDAKAKLVLEALLRCEIAATGQEEENQDPSATPKAAPKSASKKSTGKKSAGKPADAASSHLIAVAKATYPSVVLRNLLEFNPSILSAVQRNALSTHAHELAQTTAGSQVVQKLIAASTEAEQTALWAQFSGNLDDVVAHVSASHCLQCFLSIDKGAKKSVSTTARKAVKQFLFGEIAFEQLSKAIAKNRAGTHTLQLIINDEALFTRKDLFQLVDNICAITVDGEEDEEGHKTYNGAMHWAMDPSASYALQMLMARLKKTKEAHAKAKEESKAEEVQVHIRKLMGMLKDHVYSLSLAPGRGNITLDSMFICASEKLKDSMRQVIFLKSQSFFEDVPVASKQLGGTTESQRNKVGKKRDRDGDDTEGTVKRSRKEGKTGTVEGAEKKKTTKKIRRTLPK